MDGVYDQAGRLDRDHTEFMIGNDYVLATAQAHPDAFLAGVSINPMRRDAIDEVHRCAEAGAALVKVLPNAQQFDPAAAHHKPFYRALAARRLPLLSHVGYEFSLIGKDQSVGDPNRLRVPLDECTMVIAAHACSYGLMLHEKFLPTLRELAGRYRGFYADVSALTLPNRFRMLLHLRKHPALHPRLLFGTDYPLPVFRFPAWGRGGSRTRNRFDRQVTVCRALGVGFGSLGDILPRAGA
jgi:predicted TIM-barrel fold metal-dependent hydrolase